MITCITRCGVIDLIQNDLIQNDLLPVALKLYLLHVKVDCLVILDPLSKNERPYCPVGSEYVDDETFQDNVIGSLYHNEKACTHYEPNAYYVLSSDGSYIEWYKGRDRNGYDQDGYDQDGYNKRGLNKHGLSRGGMAMFNFLNRF